MENLCNNSASSVSWAALNREAKLINTKEALKRILSFLKNYLPYANSHSKDFITLNHWEDFLPNRIQEELMTLRDEELISLPFQKVNCETRDTADCSDDWDKFDCSYFTSAPKLGGKCNIYADEMKRHCPNWIHKDLQSFVSEAQSHTLECSKLLCTVDDLKKAALCGERGGERFISQYMNHKKSHEVEIMGGVCAALAKSGNVDVVSMETLERRDHYASTKYKIIALHLLIS